jgi:hypothetical protein
MVQYNNIHTKIICPTYDSNDTPKKFKSPINSFYRDGSFVPPKPQELDEPSDIARYGYIKKKKLQNYPSYY